MRAKSIQIPVSDALELVYPHALTDVLSTLKEMGAIGSFFVGDAFVIVRRVREKRFDIALHLLETSEASAVAPNPKKPR